MNEKLNDVIKDIIEIIDSLSTEWSNEIEKKEIKTGKYSLRFKNIIGDEKKLEAIRHEVDKLDNAKWSCSGWNYGMNKVNHNFIVDFKIPLKYSYEDKMNKIGTMKLIENGKETNIPIYRVILNRQWKDDLDIMAEEEYEYGIAYSDINDYEGFEQSLDVEYNIDFSREFWKKMTSKFADGIIDIEGWWHCRDTGLRNDHIYQNPNYYFNNVKKEDNKNIMKIKKDIEEYTDIKVEYKIYNQ